MNSSSPQIGFIDSRTVPFRLTQNLTTFLGLPLLNGRFATSIATVAESIRESKDEMDPILRLLMRDDIVAWYCKSMAKSDSILQELERQLVDRVSKNVSHLQTRFFECAPKKTEKESENAKNDLVDEKVRDLISAASSSEKLCMMPANYQAWL
jgi:transformation/transcription domain-associated protein